MLCIGKQVFGKAPAKPKDTAVNKTQEILMLNQNIHK
jgi:nitric oxide reductase large subunit